MSLFPKCFDCGALLARPLNSRPRVCPSCKTGNRGGARAVNIVQRAIRDGLLPHPASRVCEDCGNAAQVYDHRDYNRPLLVEPVCHTCNMRRGPATRLREAA